VIRRATALDHGWIREVASEVYRELGDYGAIIGSWLDHPGALAYLEGERAGERRGFILVGFYHPDGVTGWVADLLAIAVAPPFQRQGIGRRLLDHAVHLAAAAGRTRGVREMRLTVADTNRRGQALFASAGFTVMEDDHGRYDGGQRAIRMTLALASAA
jgi:ribosomal protein S18 acetylase RimI-like enzyme